jgi:CheY-like chemotaxis protein
MVKSSCCHVSYTDPIIKPFHLLLVDDESSVLQTLRMVLENEGYQVMTAESCAQALALLQKNSSFDGVITDLNMEQEDIGLEVARIALQTRPRPVVVVLTGFASLANSRQALELGIDYMAHKPVELSDLLPALNRLVSRRRESDSP